MLMGFIHNRQHINRAKECPDRGRLSGHLMRHLSGTKKGISVTKNLMSLLRGISVTGVTSCTVKVGLLITCQMDWGPPC
jgi:hypothetical protein